MCGGSFHSQFRFRHLRLPQLVGYGEMQMIGSGRRFGRDVDVLVESGVLHSDVLSFGKRLFDTELAALFLMDFDVDTLYPVLGCNLALQVKVASGNGGLTVLFAHFVQGDNRFSYVFIFFIVIAGGEGKHAQTQQQHSCHE